MDRLFLRFRDVGRDVGAVRRVVAAMTSLFADALALANEIEQAWAEYGEAGFYEYPWEHLGDAERDVRRLVKGLNQAAEVFEKIGREATGSTGIPLRDRLVGIGQECRRVLGIGE